MAKPIANMLPVVYMLPGRRDMLSVYVHWAPLTRVQTENAHPNTSSRRVNIMEAKTQGGGTC